MDSKKQKALEKAGWKFGDVEDFLGTFCNVCNKQLDDPELIAGLSQDQDCSRCAICMKTMVGHGLTFTCVGECTNKINKMWKHE